MFALKSIEDTLRHLGSTRAGLSDEAVASIRAAEGWNELPEKKRSLLLLFARQFQDIFVYILFGALLISVAVPFFEGEELGIRSFLDSIAIFAILLINAVLGFVQEYKAEEAIALLQKLSAPHVRVRRGGEEAIIASRELVPGDVVILEAGDRVSADGRLIHLSHLQVNESSLTGESEAATKTVDVLTGSLAIPDQTNMVFAGTLVTRGSGEQVVTATGLKTEIGKIAKLVSDTENPPTPLQERMTRLSISIGWSVMGICLLLIGIGLGYGFSILEILLIGVSLAVAAVPEGLPAVVTVCLALGVRRMVKKNVLVRRLESLETLGSVNIICSDKTGTITENRMKVVELWATPMAELARDDEERLDLLVQIAASCNRANLPSFGDPTEIGLLSAAEERDVERLPIDDEPVPFTSEEKYMVTVHGDRTFLKGAPEKILQLVDPGLFRDEMHSQIKRMAEKGLRVLACAVQQGNGPKRIAGLIGMEDPPRPGVGNAIREAKSAGIRTMMITGDNIITASAIAKSVGIEGGAMEGNELDSLTDEQLCDTVKTVSVYARVSPTHKLRILEALQRNGNVVAMSGDGVNDAPALKGAHVGVAMGKNGTQIAREAASIVLTDDNYVTIVSAVREGRHIYDNIQKFILFLMQTNFYELLFFFVTIALNLPLPYIPLHILWINLMTDGLPALALGVEPPEPDIMRRPPRPRSEGIFDGQWTKVILAAVLPFCIGFLYMLHKLQIGMEITHIRTHLLTYAIFYQLFFTFTIRSRRPVWQIGIFSNKWLLLAISVPLSLQWVLLYTPVSQVFELHPLTALEVAGLAAMASLGLVVFELLKVVENWLGMSQGRASR